MHFTKTDGIHYFIDQKARGRKRVAVPKHLWEEILAQSHGGKHAGHFSGGKLYRAISRSWCWPALYKDVIEYCRNCFSCTVVAGSGRKQIPPLNPIPVQRPFQIFGVDSMELPVTECGNRYVIVSSGFLDQVAIELDQKAIRIASSPGRFFPIIEREGEGGKNGLGTRLPLHRIARLVISLHEGVRFIYTMTSSEIGSSGHERGCHLVKTGSSPL